MPSSDDEDPAHREEDGHTRSGDPRKASWRHTTEEEDKDFTPRASQKKGLGSHISSVKGDKTLESTCTRESQPREATACVTAPSFEHAVNKWERLGIPPKSTWSLDVNPAEGADERARGGARDGLETESRPENSSNDDDQSQPDEQTATAVEEQPRYSILGSTKQWLRRRQTLSDPLIEDSTSMIPLQDVECQPRQTAFDLSVVLSVTTLLCPPQYPPTPAGSNAAHVRISYHARLQPVLAGDDSANLFAFPIVISNGLRDDETCRLDHGESRVHLQNSDFPLYLPGQLTANGDKTTRACSAGKEHPATITIIRYADDLTDPIDVFFEITYVLPHADRGSYLSVIVPTFRPRVGVVRNERVYMARPSPPLVMKARTRGVGSSWDLREGIADDVLVFQRLFCPIGSPPKLHAPEAADDLCLKFHRWPSVVYDDGLNTLYHHDDRLDVISDINLGTVTKAPRACNSSMRRNKIAWDARIELSRLFGATICCRLTLNVSVGSDPILLVVDPCGWLASHFVLDGRCLSSSAIYSNGDRLQQELESRSWLRSGSSAYEALPSTIYDADWIGKCLQDDQGYYVVMRQPAMDVGKVVTVEMCWYESPLVHEYYLQEQKFTATEKGEGGKKVEGWCEAPLPKIVSHDIVGARLTSDLDDCKSFSTPFFSTSSHSLRLGCKCE